VVQTPIAVSAEVADALSGSRPVVALESTLICQGLPAQQRLPVARQIEAAVRAHGAVPATIGVVEGRLVVGLTGEQVEHLAGADHVAKLGLRDVATAVALGRDGATTVASTAGAAARAGIDVFATGGLGGVHRAARTSWDESADLAVLAHTAVTVVCSGVKSILDVAATLERLESLSVAVLGYRTDRFAGFYQTDSGHPVQWRVDSPEEVAAVMRARRLLDLSPAALVVAQPLPEEDQLPPRVHERVLTDALEAADRAGVRGKEVTPFLLERFHRDTDGGSVAANVAIIVRNAALAADIAVAAADR
jgi:pseudouridine-5'-phosphate glycosidase